MQPLSQYWQGLWPTKSNGRLLQALVVSQLPSAEMAENRFSLYASIISPRRAAAYGISGRGRAARSCGSEFRSQSCCGGASPAIAIIGLAEGVHSGAKRLVVGGVADKSAGPAPDSGTVDDHGC